ncbi:divalent-cation tolerance protein CutA [Sulfurisphaera ohwakuensis]|uniref:Divalent cation tolerance protein CutA n=1 Tax=Sulfurisphaera ohwakuensis TaxID=69656 RepID=A0A650CGW8_SULOH|nr:divalent-cation tolerance protein CutA [Sulfurisphaera ohwakuensis]MBB5252525.1 periplasmic divalent cation tolerance protein [Sulfurisphaera ohwakuensis]QGR17030.1 divalent cation tolerance protein CutA [Sulfurisphaera ohwakuensis]
MSYIIALTTIGGMESAKKIAKTLVDERLAACVNIIPYVKSFYVWEDKTTEDDESLLIIKSDEKVKEKLINRIKELHTYTLPEIIIINFNDGLPDYLKWISESVRRSEDRSK